MRVPIPGYADTALVTGRGDTPEQAARNLTETIQATKAALAPAPAAQTEPLHAPRSREQVLAGLLTCGMQKAVTKGDMGLVERLAKAAAIVLAKEHLYQDPNTPDHYELLGQMRHAQMTLYHVNPRTLHCTCPDFSTHNSEAQEKRHMCKHLLAVMMYERITTEVSPTRDIVEQVCNPTTRDGSYNGRTLVNGK